MRDERQLTIATVEGALLEGWDAGSLFTGEVHPVADLFPMMTDDELDDLAADIKANGLIHPIVLDVEGRLIDGRNRLAACQRAGVEPTYAALNGHDPVAFILSANVTRRHLSKGQAAMAVARSKSSVSEDLTAEDLAALAGTSTGRIGQAMIVLKYLPALSDDVLSTATTLDKAYELARSEKLARQGSKARLARLQAEAPDLAVLVQEERLSLNEAFAAMEKRERDEKERVARLTRQLNTALDQLDPRAIPVSDYAKQWLDVDPAVIGEHADFSAARARKAADALLHYAILKENENRG